MLSMDKVTSGYGENIVLRGLTMHVKPGQVVCLMGRNGVGKTTLMKTMMGILPARSGTIRVGDRTLTQEPPDRRAKAGIGYVPQGREIFPQLSVEDNLLLGLEALDRRERRQRTIPDDIHELFPMLRSMLRRRGGDLSGGQQQQLAIARVLAARPKVLLLDEPMEGIQPSIVQEIEAILEGLKAARTMSIVLVEQALSFATRIADYFYVLDRGTIVSQGEPDQLDESMIKQHLSV